LGLLLFAAGKLFISVRRASRNSRVGKVFSFALPIVEKSVVLIFCRFQSRLISPIRIPSPTTDLPPTLVFNLGRNVVKGSLTVQHHFDRGLDSETFNDPGGWDRASYNHHPCDDFEPLPDIPNPYREASLAYLKLMWDVDEYLAEAKDARFAVIVVAIVLGWPSTRGLTVTEIADQIECSPATISRACARFREMAGLAAGGGVRFIRPGAGSNGDKPAAVQA
jgi:hypothetical protein